MRRKFRVMVNGKEYIVEIEELGTENVSSANVSTQSQVPQMTRPKYEIKDMKAEKPLSSGTPKGAVTSPMPGKVQKIMVHKGDTVKKGDILMILEAMKMENEIVSPRDGIIEEINANPGDNVERGAVLIVIR